MDGAPPVGDRHIKLTIATAPADVHFTSPASNTVAVVGKSIIVSLSARSAVKVRSVGFRATGAVPLVDSVAYSSPLSDSVSGLDTIPIPASAPTGPINVVPFVIDSLGQPHVTAALLIQPLSNHSTPGCDESTPRMEVNDTLHVEANDQKNHWLGYEEPDRREWSRRATLSWRTEHHVAAQTFELKLPSRIPTQVLTSVPRNSKKSRLCKASGA